jgi:hypothetical protein
MIEQGLFAYLSSVPEVQALIGAAPLCRLYPLLLSQADHTPAGVYQLASVDRGRTYCGTDKLIYSTMQLDSYGRRYSDACTLAAAFRVALLDFAGMMGTVLVRDCALLSESDFEDPEPGLYRRYQSWGIWHIDG